VTGRAFRPGEIDIEKFELRNYRNLERDALDITQISYEFSYYESIFSPAVSLEILINDGVGLINDFPLVGDEHIILSFKTKGADDSNSIDLNMRSYKVGNRVRSGERAMMYPIYAMNERAVTNPKTEVVSAFGGKISDFIRQFVNFFRVEQTQGEYKYVATGQTVFDTITILAREAESDINPSSAYVFYETSDGYHFVTLDTLFNQPTSKQYYYAQKSVRRSNDISGDAISDDKLITTLEHSKSNDLIGSMENGLYGNLTSAIDPIRKTFNTRGFDYFGKGFNQTQHIPQDANRIQPSGEFQSLALNSQSANEKYFVSDLVDVAPIEYIDEYDTTVALRGRKRHRFSGLSTSLFSQLEVITFRISVTGDSSRHAGDIIEIYVPEPSSRKNKINQYDKYLSGRFLVTSVRHMLQSDNKYITIMECVKDSFEELISDANI